ncbi:MAG: hypothetical protein AB2L12_13255 [Smithellaceae bacterium]
MATLLMIIGALFLIMVVLFFCCEHPLILFFLIFAVPAFLIVSLFSGWGSGFIHAIAFGVGGLIGLLNLDC